MTTEVEKPAAEATYEDLREKIIYQVEHYFGDFNLPKDKFLLSKTKENQGWIELDVLLTFNRLKNLTTDKEIIVKAVRSSESGLVEVSEDNVRLRRNPQKPLPESFKDEFVGKTVYVKGFPKDISLDELIEFFKPFEAGCVKMRRFSFDRSFKGSVFVLLPTVEAAKKLRETTGLKYKDSELLILMAQEYADKKAAEKDLSKKAKKEKTEQTGEDELGEMARVEQILEKMDKKPGVFMILRGLKKEYEITFQDIKGYFNKDDDKKVAYVELFPDEEKAVVRFSEEDGAVRARDAQDPVGRITIKGHDIVAEALTGVAEKEQYRKQAALKLKRFENDRSNRKRAGQHRRQGYRGRGGKRTANDDGKNGEDGTSSKKAKTE